MRLGTRLQFNPTNCMWSSTNLISVPSYNCTNSVALLSTPKLLPFSSRLLRTQTQPQEGSWVSSKVINRLIMETSTPRPTATAIEIIVNRKYNRPEDVEEVLRYLDKNGHALTNSCYGALLRACTKTGALTLGRKLHDQINRLSLQLELQEWNNLISMYAKCGSLEEASKAFGEMQQKGFRPDLYSWNTIIAAYGRKNRLPEAFDLFKQMQEKGMKPDVATWTALITAYGLQGNMTEASRVFQQMKEQGIKPNVVTWTSLIKSFARLGQLQSALDLFHQMKEEGVQPNVITWNALITGYSHCGHLSVALDLLKQMKQTGIRPDVTTWNSLTFAHAKQGKLKEAFGLLNRMKRSRLKPNSDTWHGLVTGLSIFQERSQQDPFAHSSAVAKVLEACTQFGFIYEAVDLYFSIESLFEMTPEVKHQNCIMDGLVRLGRLNDAEKFIERLQVPHESTWTTFLNGCRNRGDFARAERASKQKNTVQ